MWKKQPMHIDFLSDNESQLPSPRTVKSPFDQLGQTLSADRLFPKAKRGLLSPIPRKTIRKSTQSQKQLKMNNSGRTHTLPLKPNLRKGFQLLRTLFKTNLSPAKASTPQLDIPLKHQPSHMKDFPVCITVPEAEIRYKVSVREPPSRSVSPANNLSHLLEFESGRQTPRRKSSTRDLMQSIFVDVERSVEKMQTSRESSISEISSIPEKKLIPVMRIHEIEADELVESSESEKGAPSLPVSRRSSRLAQEAELMRRGTMTTLDKPTQTERRFSLRGDKALTRSETKRELMADYQLKTAEMLSDTQFRVKGFKQQRAIPHRYFKNLS